MDYRARMARAQELMRAQDLDWLLIAPSTDLLYLTGLHAHVGSRLTAALLPAVGEATLVVPVLEAAGLDPAALPGKLVTWPDGADPLPIVANTLRGAGVVAVGEGTWARDLLPLQELLPGTRMVPATGVLRPLRTIKDTDEIGLLRRAAHAADRVFARVAGSGLAGRTELEVAALLGALLVEEGHDETAFTHVGSGPNGAEPHHQTGSRRIERGDLVVLDFGGSIEGYHSDTTRTVAVGEPGEEARRVYEAVRTAQEAGVQAVRPGVTTGSVDAAARGVLRDAGYGEYFIHRTGHGLGLNLHEPPYLLEGSETRLEPGMVFSVEPGAYLPGRFGVRIEDIVVVTSDGMERLNVSDRSLLVVD